MTRYLAVLVLILVAVAAAQNVQFVSAPNTPADSGKEMYAAYCASCHGAQGRGDGPASSSYKTPRLDLTVLAKNHNGVFPAAYVNSVISGKVELPSHKTENGMPKWRNVLIGVDFQRSQDVVERRVHNLTDYIQQLQVK